MTQPNGSEAVQSTQQASSSRLRPGYAVSVWCIAASLLLIASGYFRGVQANLEDIPPAKSPFALSLIPKEVGNWRVVEGSETLLDPQTTRITGSTDHILRNYVDEMTGVTLSVLILYGPAGPVTPHTPQVCYPASGFASVGPTLDRDIAFGENESAKFRTSVFAKSGGRVMLLQTVYHSYELNGVWSPEVEGRKIPRSNPGVFKVQIQRRSFEREARGENEPIEEFIAKLLPIIERMAREGEPAAAPTSKAA